MKHNQTQTTLPKTLLAAVLALALLAGGCASRGDESTQIPETSPGGESFAEAETEAATEAAEREPETSPVDDAGSTSGSGSAVDTDSAADTDPAATGMVRTNFTLLFGADLGEEISFSLDLPEDWTVDSTSYLNTLFDENGWIAQVEMHTRPQPAGEPFADLEDFWPDALSAKDLEVSGCPIRCYIVPARGEGVIEKTQYMYYVSVDGVDSAYPFIWFSVDNKDQQAEARFDEIISSFRLLEN